jgi:hypothetical protein
MTKAEASILIRSNLETFKSFSKGYPTGSYDAFLVVMTELGSLKSVQQVSFSSQYTSAGSGTAANNIQLGNNVLRRIGEYYVFAGNAPGFATVLQNEYFSTSSSTIYDNSFVMKYLLDKDNTYKCLYDGPSDFPSAVFVSTMRSIDTSQEKQLQQTDETITYNNYFKVYSSPYSGAFDLLDTMYIPRPCVQSAANLTQMDYFYGQKPKNYSMRLEPSYKQRATTVLS